MKAKTELFLYRLFWLAEKPFTTNYFYLGESFGCWAYRNGLLDLVHQLEEGGILEATKDPASGRRLHRLTEAGSALVLRGREPEAAWARVWDRKWRLIIFDIPSKDDSKRRQLNRALGHAGCGCLQGSVWITPMTSPEIEKIIAQDDPDCTHLLLLRADSKGPSVDAKMVGGAWNFEAINAAYEVLQSVLDRFPQVVASHSPDALAQWTGEEKTATDAVLRMDPLLPSALLPPSYLGKRVWRNRLTVISSAAKLAASLTG